MGLERRGAGWEKVHESIIGLHHCGLIPLVDRPTQLVKTQLIGIAVWSRHDLRLQWGFKDWDVLITGSWLLHDIFWELKMELSGTGGRCEIAMRVYNEMRVYGPWESCESRPNCAPLTILVSTKIRVHNKKQKHKNSKYMFFSYISVVEVCWSLFSGKAVMHDLGYGRDPTWILDFWPGPRYVGHAKYILWKHIFKFPTMTDWPDYDRRLECS